MVGKKLSIIFQFNQFNKQIINKDINGNISISKT